MTATLLNPATSADESDSIEQLKLIVRNKALPMWVRSDANWYVETRNRTKQRLDGDWWDIGLYLGGRGTGKTRSGAQKVSRFARLNPGTRIALITETFTDGRDVCIEGESGLLRCVPSDAIEVWNRSLGELVFTNKARIKIFTSEKPEKLRGPQFHFAWIDEFAKLRYLRQTWENLMFGLRLGQHPQVIITSTPKPLGLLHELVAEAMQENPRCMVVRGSSWENAANLAPTTLRRWKERYEGTRLGRQELEAELLDDYEGALWKRDEIQSARLDAGLHPMLRMVAIGVDPSAYSPELDLDAPLDAPGAPEGQGKETGVVVVGIDHGQPPHAYVLADESGRWTGEEWGLKVVSLARKYQKLCPTVIVPEMNLGGPTVLSTIRLTQAAHVTGDPPVRFYKTGNKIGVRAAHAKRARAEPVATLAEQGRLHHVGRFTELEDQLVTWDPRLSWSPDRMDALVWAVTALEPWNSAAQTGSGLDAMTAASMPLHA